MRLNSRLKMPVDTQLALMESIRLILQDQPDFIFRYEHGKFPRADKVKCLQTRFNWDLFWLALRNSPSVFVGDLSDSHIDSFLKGVCPKVERKY